MKSQILELHEQLKSGKITSEQIIANCKAAAEKYAACNSIITPIFKPSDTPFDPNNLLSCIPYSLKDNITTQGITTTGGSSYLKNYIPPFNATAYGILKVNGATLVSKDSLDEFGLGGTGTFCFTGPVRNPNDLSRCVGGSSSGSAVNVATGVSVFALGTDTGDSVRRPPACVGVIGYKPTYGSISRYGVFPYSPSFDHVGIIAKYVADTTIVAEALFKQDPKDYTSTSMIKDVKFENLKAQPRIRFVVLTNLIKMLDQKYQDIFNNFLQKLKDAGHTIIEAELDRKVLDAVDFGYKMVTYVEGCSCWSKLQSITYGANEGLDSDDYETTLLKSRSPNFGKQLKRRFTIGAYLANREDAPKLDDLARRIRHMIQDAQLNLLKKGDCIIGPTLSTIALPIDNMSKPDNFDDWIMIDNFSGTPAISIPFTKVDNMPWGLHITCDVYQDMKLLNIAYTLEELLGGDNE